MKPLAILDNRSEALETILIHPSVQTPWNIVGPFSRFDLLGTYTVTVSRWGYQERLQVMA